MAGSVPLEADCWCWALLRVFTISCMTVSCTHSARIRSGCWKNTLLSIASLERNRERERDVLFNNALNTFYVRLYGIRQDNTYHGLCYTSREALAGTRNSSIGPPHEGLIRRPIAPRANALPLSYVPLPISARFQERDVVAPS